MPYNVFMGSILRNKTLVEQAIEETNSVKEALEFLGLRAAGGNYKSFYRWCETHGLTPKHGTPELNLAGLIRKREESRVPDELIFCEHSSYSRSLLKKRVIKDGMLEYVCNECGLKGEWNDKPMSLQLSHKNGVYNDNRLENLEFLCPNCHSQTNDFAGKRRIYDKPLLPRVREGKQYREMSYTHKRTVERPPYQDLISMVESHGYSATGRKYGVSDNSVRKWVKHYEKYGSLV
jgi:5-methylcytosine-specific restriction endonuclease McrA